MDSIAMLSLGHELRFFQFCSICYVSTFPFLDYYFCSLSQYTYISFTYIVYYHKMKLYTLFLNSCITSNLKTYMFKFGFITTIISVYMVIAYLILYICYEKTIYEIHKVRLNTTFKYFLLIRGFILNLFQGYFCCHDFPF